MPLLRWDAAGALGADVAVTTRHGGVSRPPYDSLNLGLHVGDDADAVATNRRRAAQAFGVELAELVFARQVHGAHVAPVRGADGGRGVTGDDDAVAEADVLVTEGPGVTPVIMVADCVPMALVDPVARVLAGRARRMAGHAGGRGRRRVGRHGRTGGAPRADPRVRRAGRGTRALPGDRRGRARPGGRGRPGAAGTRAWRARTARGTGSSTCVAANRQQLQLGGVHGDHIDECGMSTADERFFSDRAARPCGRFALLARLVE